MRSLAIVLFVAALALWLLGGSIVHIRAGIRLGISSKRLGMWMPIWIPWSMLTGQERLKIIMILLFLVGSYIFFREVYAP
jgi:hypothetical protein